MYYVLLCGAVVPDDVLQNGPWTYVPAATCQSTFAKIPVYSPKAMCWFLCPERRKPKKR